MTVFIIGGGINGLSTGYWLSQKNIKTLIIEKNPEPCQEASYINGCQHFYSKIQPLITMAQTNQISLLNALQLFEKVDLKWISNLIVSWGYLEKNTNICNWLSKESKFLFEKEFPEIKKYKPIVQVFNHIGYKYLKPNTYTIRNNIITYTNDYISNPLIYNKALIDRYKHQGGEIIRSKLKSIVYKDNSNIIIDLICDPPLPYKFIPNDKVVIATGVASKQLIPTLPMMSVYGAAIFNVKSNKQSVPCFIQNGYQSLKMDNHTRIVFGNIFSNTYMPSPEITNRLRGLYPDAKIYGRPVSADGLPIISKLSDNLFVCTGQGFFGYTLGLFSGKIASKMILGEKLTENEQYLNLNRFWF